MDSKDMKELSTDEMDQVSGGKTCTVNAGGAGKKANVFCFISLL